MCSSKKNHTIKNIQRADKQECQSDKEDLIWHSLPEKKGRNSGGGKKIKINFKMARKT
jgi:hypothetical protein